MTDAAMTDAKDLKNFLAETIYILLELMPGNVIRTGAEEPARIRITPKEYNNTDSCIFLPIFN